MLNNKWLILLVITLLPLTGCQSTGGQLAGSAADITRESNAALQDLYASNPEARQLGRRAKSILVFPSIVKQVSWSARNMAWVAPCLKTAEQRVIIMPSQDHMACKPVCNRSVMRCFLWIMPR